MVKLISKMMKLLSKEVDSSESKHDNKLQENESVSPNKKMLSETEERAIALIVRYGVSLR